MCLSIFLASRIFFNIRRKNKTVLLEKIHELKAVKNEEKALAEQAEARKGRAQTRLERKAAREAKKAADAEAAAQAS